jgi:hypothetical protein
MFQHRLNICINSFIHMFQHDPANLNDTKLEKLGLEEFGR